MPYFAKNAFTDKAEYELTGSSTSRVFVSSLVHRGQSEPRRNDVDWPSDLRRPIFWMLSSVFDVEGGPGRGSPSVVSHPSLNLLNSLKTRVRDKHSLPYISFNTAWASVAVFLGFTRNLRLTRFSVWTLYIFPTRRKTRGLDRGRLLRWDRGVTYNRAHRAHSGESINRHRHVQTCRGALAVCR